MTERRKLWLHIGLPKTGTTSIEDFLAANPKWLAEQGVLYPQAARVLTTHSNLTWRFSPQLCAALMSEIEEADLPAMILSADTFWGNMPQTVATWLAERFDTTVIVYLRRQDKWVESMWRQLMKDAERGPEELREPLALREAAWLHEWDKRLGQFQEWFGADRIHAKLYDLVPDVVSDFLGQVGLGEASEAIVPGRSNETMHPSWVEFLSRARLTPMDQHPLSAMIQMLLDLPGEPARSRGPSVMPLEVRRELMERCRPGNEWIARNLLTDEEAQVLLADVRGEGRRDGLDQDDLARLLAGMWKSLWPHDQAQVFWDTGGGFTEGESHRVEVGRRHDEIIVELPGSPTVRTMRFDPADGPVWMRLDYMEIETPQGQRSVLAPTFSNAASREGDEFCFTCSDPMMFFRLGQETPVARVRVRVRYLGFGADARVQQLQRQVADLERRLSEVLQAPAQVEAAAEE